MKIIITGNPVDGFQYWGPFTKEEVEGVYCLFEDDGDWWVADIIAPIVEDGVMSLIAAAESWQVD